MLNCSLDQAQSSQNGGWNEESCQFGPQGNCFGVLTHPAIAAKPRQRQPVVVLLNAGLIHRVGPSRLYVLLARELAARGFAVLRVDLYGRGDSPPPADVQIAEMAAASFVHIRSFISSRYGTAPLILGGLCSGADDAIRLAATEEAVQGLILLDPICFEDSGFRWRSAMQRWQELFTHPVFSARRFTAYLAHRLSGRGNADDEIDPLTIRNAPSLAVVQDAFVALDRRKGHALSIFTRYATSYYNHEGQLAAVALPDGATDCLEEISWPDVHHTFSIGPHRRRLIDTVISWCEVKF